MLWAFFITAKPQIIINSIYGLNEVQKGMMNLHKISLKNVNLPNNIFKYVLILNV